MEDTIEEGCWRWVALEVECDERGEEREDEGEGYLYNYQSKGLAIFLVELF